MLSQKKLGADAQPINKAFNYARNRDKAAYGLRGILEGVVADQKLNEAEMLFLDAWVRSQEKLEPKSDVVDLLDSIGNILKDGYIDSDELEDLKNLINDVIEFGTKEAVKTEDCINELLGILLGIVADGKLMNEEINLIDRWLSSNCHLEDYWPVNVLVDRLQNILSDGEISENERSDLLETLKQFTGSRFEETGAVDGMVAEVFSDAITGFDHDGKIICFTGKFVNGTRNVCENIAVKRGAKVVQSITKEVDVLILGTLASTDWRFTSHGRKIEKALELKASGHDILILSERTWLKFL